MLFCICRWGTPYLTRDFFHLMASKMGDQVLLVIAEEQDELVAGALNLIGGDTLYGRLWGCLPESYYPSLHFEACYYQVCSIQVSYRPVNKYVGKFKFVVMVITQTFTLDTGMLWSTAVVVLRVIGSYYPIVKFKLY